MFLGAKLSMSNFCTTFCPYLAIVFSVEVAMLTVAQDRLAAEVRSMKIGLLNRQLCHTRNLMQHEAAILVGNSCYTSIAP